ncbi:MAG: hydroxymethylbilane synthase [Ruminococcus sp.]|nr:hydroxymethylbilane synthase [Ruminococcus sp.]
MKIKIGTRKSKLALAQTQMVANEICNTFPDTEIEIVHISTTGDKILDKPLTEIGGKGVFVSEIEKALQNKVIDVAVHSAKDLPVSLAQGLEISGVLKRGNYRDVLVTKKDNPIKNNADFIIGTGSLRRRLNLKRLYPNVSFENIRGNVDTRLNKLENGEYDGIILAAAGLERLGLNSNEKFDFTPFEYTEFLPASCQGIIAVESRKEDFITPIIKAINDENTFLSFETERYILKLLNADCGMPLGAYSYVQNNEILITLSKDSEKTVCGKEIIPNRFSLAEELVSKL